MNVRRIVGVVVGVVDGGSTSIVDVYAVELIGQLRYQCGLNSNCRRSILPSIAKSLKGPVIRAIMQSTQYVILQHEVTYCIMNTAWIHTRNCWVRNVA